MMLISNVIVDITILHSLFVFSQSCVQVPGSLSNVRGLEVGALDLETAPCLLLGSSLSYNVSQ